MQVSEAAQLRKAWGKKPCLHPELDKEYYLGSQTGDYVCTTCGEAFTEHEAERLHKSKEK